VLRIIISSDRRKSRPAFAGRLHGPKDRKYIISFVQGLIAAALTALVILPVAIARAQAPHAARAKGGTAKEIKALQM